MKPSIISSIISNEAVFSNGRKCQDKDLNISRMKRAFKMK